MPIKPAEVKSWMDNGVMFALSLLVIWGLSLGIWILAKWALKRLDKPSQQTPSVHPCEGCVHAEEVRTPADLVNHRLFAYIRAARAMSIPNLKIPDPGRRLLVVDFLDLKFRIVSEHMLGWLRDHLDLIPEMAPDVMYAKLMTLFSRMVETYEAEGHAMGMPPAFISRFRSWHEGHFQRLTEDVRAVCDCDWIETTQMMALVLTHVDYVMNTTSTDASRAMRSLNGSLTGQVYRGIVIGPCHPSQSEGGQDRQDGPSQR